MFLAILGIFFGIRWISISVVDALDGLLLLRVKVVNESHRAASELHAGVDLALDPLLDRRGLCCTQVGGGRHD